MTSQMCKRWMVSLGWLTMIGLVPQAASAQDEDVDDGTPSTDVSSEEGTADSERTGPRPPELLEAVTVDPPTEIHDRVSVEFSLVIETDGSVSEATVIASASPEFDAAAHAAVLQFRFRPAELADGTPMRAQVRFRYDFDPPPPPPTGALLFMVRDGSDQPVAQAFVGVSGTDGQPAVPEPSQEPGTFRFVDLPEGEYSVEVRADGFEPIESREGVEADVETTVILRLREIATFDDEETDELTFGAEAIVEAPPREVLRRTIGGREAAGIAGTRGDALRAIEVLPGVARPPFGSGQLIIRGSAPADSQVFLDGVPVPLLYHFGGLTSFYPSPLIEQLDFFPSNFSARYGRRVGGTVEVRSRPPRRDRPHLTIDANFVDASVLVETPVSDWGAVAAGFRYSLIGYWLAPLLEESGTTNVAAPVYLDYQVIGFANPSDADEITIRAYGSRDGFEFTSTEPEDENPFETGQSDFRSDFDRIDVAWKHRYSSSTFHELSVAVGSRRERFQLGGAQRNEVDVQDLSVRGEFHHRFSDMFNLRLGVDIYVAPYEINFFGPPPQGSEGGFLPPEFDQVEAVTNGTAIQPAAYAELDFFPTPNLHLILGLRGDYFGIADQFAFNPRLSAIYRVRENLRLKAAVGMFTQAPELIESDEILGNPELEVFHAVHTSAGVELDLGDDLELGVEGFFKHLYNRVVEGAEGDPSFINDGIGRVYGLELSAQWDGSSSAPNPDGTPGGEQNRIGPFGFLNYTLSRSERRDRGGPWRAFDFDQPHVLTASLGYYLGRGWKVAALFRLASGSPNTPVRSSVYDVGADQYRPVFGDLNSGRDALFHRLDLRLEKRWQLDSLALTFYIDVQNAYSRQNPEGINFNYNFTQSGTVDGLPIIPSLGLRGEL
ncbi:MAG: TonB-dependent receptor [Myxococcota bacterium]